MAKKGFVDPDTLKLSFPRKRESRATAPSLALDPRFRGGDNSKCGASKRTLPKPRISRPHEVGAGGGVSEAASYLRDPEAIYRESFAAVRREAQLGHLPPDIADVAVRLIHACGMTDIVDDLAFTADVIRTARARLAARAPVLCDSAMVAAGIIRARLPASNDIICTLGDPRVPGLAKSLGTTRSAAAVELWDDDVDGALVAIGNAPTALFHLLERLRQAGPRPAAIFAFPVGFVGAAESKQALIDAGLGVPYLTLKGRRGGSALAAAAVNALLRGDAE